MSRKIQGRWATVAALAIALMAATPAQAVSMGGWGDPSGLFLRAWGWWAGVGGKVADRMPTRPEGTERLTNAGLGVNPSGLAKAGFGADPNGSQGAGTSPAAGQASDSGRGADPNGG
jgi:hypothetical protein